MPFRVGKKERDEVHFLTDITDKDELEEIHRIANRLDEDEKVCFVAKQSRMKPGGSAFATPNIVFATDKRIIIRNPTMLGMRENIEAIPYGKITSVKLEKGVFSSTIVIRAPGLSELNRASKYGGGMVVGGRGEDGQIDALSIEKGEHLFTTIREGIEGSKKSAEQSHATQVTYQQLSIADELTKLATLKEQGIITNDEFSELKQGLLKKVQGY
ncbi:MAG: PH domain-containing protein [Thermoproteota archaeon]|nr:PH domain-containing protein [Thermoproteota archaeon]